MTVMIKRSQVKAPPLVSNDEAWRLRQIEKNQTAIALLDSWAEADEAEIRDQVETWEFLKRALDEDRLSDRKFFG